MTRGITRAILPKGLWPLVLTALVSLSGCGGSGNDNAPSSAPNHTVNVSAAPAAGGTVTGGGVYSDGNSVTVTASPNTGYHFVNWTEGGTEVSTLASYTFSVTADRTLVANFSINSYSVSTSLGLNGTINPAGATVYHGGTTSFTITPANGYSIGSVSGCNGSLNGVTGTYTTGQITADCTVSASFIAGGGATTFFTIGTSSSPAAGGVASGGGSYSSASSVTLTAAPNTGYHFVNWTEGGTVVSTAASYTFTATANRTLVAKFAINSYTVSTSAGPNGTISPASTTVNHGGTTSFTITPASGYSIGSVSGCNGSLNGTLATYTTGQITANCTVTAGFVTGTAKPLHSIGVNAVPLDGGVVSGGGVYSDGTSVTVSATPNAGYHFVNWTEGGTAVSTLASYTFTATVNRTLDANFAINTYTIGISTAPVAGGVVTGGGTYNHGATVTATATPSTGYQFVNWTEGGTVVSTAASYAFTATTNRTLVANFAISYVIGVTAAPAAGGVVTGGGTYNHGTAVTVTATPNAGYQFINWTEGGTEVSTLAGYAFTATANRTLVANFALISTVTYTGSTPVDGATGISPIADITVTASAALDPVSINATSVTLTMETSGSPAVPSTISYDSVTKTITINPDVSLPHGFKYILTLNGVRDTIGSIVVTKIITFTVSINPAIRDITYDATGAVAAYSANTLDAVGAMAKSVNYSALGPDGMPGTADDGIGADGIWFTPDDVPEAYSAYAYDAAGNQTLAVSYTAAGADLIVGTADDGTGADGVWFTPDDVPESYKTFSYDPAGNETRSVIFTAAGVDTFLGTADDGSGADGVWLTADDIPSYYLTNNYDTSGNVLKSVNYLAPGADSIWFTVDDVPNSYTTFNYNSAGKQTRFALYVDIPFSGIYAAGADGIWFTADDVPYVNETFSYNATGNMTRSISYDAGADGFWFTPDDIPNSYYDVSYDTAGNFTQFVSFSGSGADTTWFTADDVLSAYNSYYRDAAGNLKQNASYTALGADMLPGTADDGVGADGIWFTPDDVPNFYIAYSFDAAGNQTQSVYYFAAGADGILGTADDAVGIDGTWFTGDDVPTWYETTNYDAAGNRMQWVDYSSAGADGAWFTADDVKSLETLFNTTF